MASSSTATIHKSFKYDVFLSFRGEDTRTNFIDHLYYALTQKSINTYKDDEEIKKGKLISDELIGSIEDSKFYIIVFSKNYASSSWCLDELVKIMECQKSTEHTAYPVFYDVEPTEVRWQIGAVGEAFSKHENDAAAGKWKEALKEAADLSGWELKKTADGHEAKFIQKIVEDISLELRSINFFFNEKLVGMNTRVKDVISYLETDIDDVSMIGIKGMGGGGKTTLARAVFDQISFKFEGISFVENVREVSKASLSGLASLQNKVLKDVLRDRRIELSSVYDGINMMKSRMCSRKVLVVLDDVDDIEQLEALAGAPNWFKQGSRIIMTTRDEQVLVAHRVKWILKVNLLSSMEATYLFSKYAFGRNIPIQGYEELSRQVVWYAAGLPLTIKVLGSFLCGKTESEWIDACERLKTIPLKETLQKLELSYQSLEEDYKEIFLTLACILQRWSEDLAIEALESCGYHARNGLRVLEQRSLISYAKYNDASYLRMHDHIVEMGRNIVRRLHPDKPKKHSRLWVHEEIKDIFANDLGTKATRYIRFKIREAVDLEIVMKGLRKMKELRFLHVSSNVSKKKSSNVYTEEKKYDNVNQYFHNALKYLHWDRYPLWSLPIFQGNNLVALKMAHSNIVRLWGEGETKVLKKLKTLDLSYSKLTTLDLELFPNLKVLSLRGCHELVQILMLDKCPKLISVDLSFSKLKIVELRSASNLEQLHLEGCNALEELQFPNECLKLKSVDQPSLYKLKTVNLRSALNLELLHLKDCHALEELHLSDGCLKLKSVDLSYSKLKTVDLHSALNLELLHLKDCHALEELHLSDGCLKLKSVDLSYSKLKTVDLRSALNLKLLYLKNCYALVELHLPDRCLKLTHLHCTGSKLMTLDIGLALNLKKLILKRSQELVKLHISGECLNLKKLDLEECTNLVQLHIPIGCLENIVYLVLSGCLRFKSFVFDIRKCASLRGDESLEVSPLAELHLIGKPLKICSFHPDSTLRKFQFECFYKDDPSLTRNLEMLISVGLCACTNLESFSGSICGLQRLRKLNLEGYPEAPKDLDRLECLEELTLSLTNMKHLPDSICMLKHLKVLKLESCWRIEKLPEDLGRLECLERLTLSSQEIKHLPDSICVLKNLIFLDLRNCFSLEKLPEDLGRLECLTELHLWYTKIKHLPDSICMLTHLKILSVFRCPLLENLPEDLGLLESLVRLTLSSSKIKHLPDSICMMKNLISLHLDQCSLLEKLPEDLEQLECLQSLELRECKSLQNIPISICNMKYLKRLDVSGTCISHLPQNIHLLKGLCIRGSRGLLETSGFTSKIQTYRYVDTCCVDL